MQEAPVDGDAKGPKYPKMIRFAAKREAFLKLAKAHKPTRKLGVIEEDANADIILGGRSPARRLHRPPWQSEGVDVKPRGESIEIIRLIMKDGKVYKKTLNWGADRLRSRIQIQDACL